ncbi:NUDIX domain-containing protein [Halovivax limisalsi]|uniref:NUDIX domain-containing protein n=1 Tax=Halovivax limisalsi TaxID=1453760 RepID=UPI001FFC5FC8|nr:NUDIX domain-containing protein [Halovivax limisalsi]
MTDENRANGGNSDSDSPNRDHVVTAFLRNRGEILVCRRSDAVGTYPGAWGGVSGFAEADPDAQVRVEIREETGMPDETVSFVRSGRQLPVSDPDIDREWVVHPYLFDVDTREIELSEEHTEAAWIPPTDLAVGDRETVPKLWETYERVAPTVRSIAADDEHGAAWLSIRALAVLRDRAGLLVRERESGPESVTDTESHVPDTTLADERAELADLAERLLEARPSMAVLRNRVNRAMAEAAGTSGNGADGSDAPGGSDGADWGAEAVLESTIAGIERAVDADATAAERASEFATGRVLTLSRSGTVREALRAGEPDRLFVAESRPGGEGVTVAEALADETSVTLCTDAAVAHVLATESIDAVLAGADTILPDGRVVNKTGTRAAALAAANEGVPVYAVAASEKVSTREAVNLESGDREAVYDGDAPIDVVNPTFDVTPAAAVTGIVTEDGVLEPAKVGAVATRLREYESWEGDANGVGPDPSA